MSCVGRLFGPLGFNEANSSERSPVEMASFRLTAFAPFPSRSCLSPPLPRFPASQFSSSYRCFSGGLHCRQPSLLVFPSRHRSFKWSGRAQVANPGPPSPDPEDPFGEGSPTTDLETNLGKARDGVQIFFAVLFWMSLFFWASAWDGNDNIKPKKKSWFRR